MQLQKPHMTGNINKRSNADDPCDTNKTAQSAQISMTDKCIDQNHRCYEHPKRRVFQHIDRPLPIFVMHRASWHADLNFTGAVIHDFGPV